MKKILLIGLCCLCLCGCSNKKENTNIKIQNGKIYIYKNAVLHFKGKIINNSNINCEYTDISISLNNGKIDKKGHVTLGKLNANEEKYFDDYVWFIDIEEINNIDNYEYEINEIKCTPYK